MSVVRIPPVLRVSTGGLKQVEVAGATVGEVIGGLVAAYPGLAPQLLAGDGDLNRFVNVFLNDTDVRHLQALDTPVDERDTVLLLPAMAGGATGGPVRARRLGARVPSPSELRPPERPPAGRGTAPGRP
jgi:molybdopterin converting factor small subunit